MKSPDIKQTAKIIGLLLTGLFLGWLFFGGSSSQKSADVQQHVEEAHTDEEGNIVYTCSMHPQIRRNEPGNCPICGMELIPLDEAEQQNDVTFTMTEAAVKLADIQTTRVERRTPEVEVRLPGRVATDERRVASITARFSGRIEELFVNFRGTYVSEGEKLATIYSPELISAQRELIEAAKIKEADPSFYQSVRRKLQLWELPESEIQRIEETGEIIDAMPIVSARSGFVTQKNVDVKDYVEEGTVMYKVADLSRLWVLFDAYESDLGAIQTGHSVDFTVRSHPGETFESTVTYVDPFIDPETRTARVRAEVSNLNGILKPDMLARGVIKGPATENEKLVIPRSAVLWTGKRSIVFVEHPETEVPTFEPRLVTLGNRAGDYYIVEEGLKEGEHVVTNGNFKLDSAAQLADKLSMMNREPGTGSSPGMPGMPEMDMGNEVKIDTDNTNQEVFPSGQSSVIDREQVPDAFKDQLEQFVEAYLPVKDALTNDDLQAASSNVNDLEESLSDVDMNLIENDDQMQAWMTRQEALEEHIKAVKQTEDLNEFRRMFALLSEAMSETLSTFGVDRTLYLQYCPMASNGEGAYWLSENEEISNPYMGQSMPNCGEVIEDTNF